MSHRSQVALHFVLREYWGVSKIVDDKNETIPSGPTFLSNTTPVVLDRANATFVFLCRNGDLSGVVTSIQQMEDRFNRRYKYPWVLLNEEPFTEDFKRQG